MDKELQDFELLDSWRAENPFENPDRDRSEVIRNIQGIDMLDVRIWPWPPWEELSEAEKLFWYADQTELNHNLDIDIRGNIAEAIRNYVRYLPEKEKKELAAYPPSKNALHTSVSIFEKIIKDWEFTDDKENSHIFSNIGLEDDLKKLKEKEALNKIEHENTSDIICPYCGHKNLFGFLNNTNQNICPNCHQIYEISVASMIVYSTHKIAENKAGKFSPDRHCRHILLNEHVGCKLFPGHTLKCRFWKNKKCTYGSKKNKTKDKQ